MTTTWCDAGIAQLVEHNLAMVRVASSNLVSRSIKKSVGALVKRLYSGLQIRIVQFDSETRLQRPGGEIGRHKGLKIPRTLSVRAGSTPAPGTTFKI